MERLLDGLLQRPGLQQAQMAGAAVRGLYVRDPDQAMVGLAHWSEHTDPIVRIASGVGYGVVGTRSRDALPAVLPYVERLANDHDLEVREHGAEAALEQLWLMHTDAVYDVMDHWVENKNDAVRGVVVRTIARVAIGGQIRRPSVLRQFIERGLSLYDRLVPDAAPEIRSSLAFALDDMGCLAPELVTPFVLEWSGREDAGALRLVVELAKMPFGGTCEGLEIAEVKKRLARMQGRELKRGADWVRRGIGGIDYVNVFGQELLHERTAAHIPWVHVADPYRGCQLRCEFCNARSVNEWVGQSEDTFRRRVTIVRNAAELLAKELSEERFEPRDQHAIVIGMGSDPYQPAEERFDLTRELLKVCLQLEHPVIIQTRQELVLRDVDILEKLAEQGLVNVMIAIQTAIEGIRNKIELGTATVNERFRTIRMLSKSQVPVGLMLGPIMPDLTDDAGILEDTIRRAGDAGAQWVVSQVLNLHGSARVKTKLFLDSFIATLIPRYEELYSKSPGGRKCDQEYVDRLCKQLIPELAAKHGVNDLSRMITSGKDPEACLHRP